MVNALSAMSVIIIKITNHIELNLKTGNDKIGSEQFIKGTLNEIRDEVYVSSVRYSFEF